MTWLRAAAVTALCLAGLSADATKAATQGPGRTDLVLAVGQPAPAAMAFVDADGRRITLGALAEAARPTPARALLLLRVQAAWCGTCQWHADWSRELLAAFPGRLPVVDVLVADEDNQPPSADALQAWRARAGTIVVTLADAEARQQLDARDAPPFPAPARLPRLLLLDARDLTIRAALSNPSPDIVTRAIARELATPVLRGARADATPTLIDGRFTRDQWDLIRAMRLPSSPPPDPTNRVADNPAAAAFGRTLFFDRALSPAGRACASCHAPDLLFTNGKDVASEGVGPGVRNVPTILLASHARWPLWDGRVDSHWAQAVMPFEDATEMGSSRLFVAHAVRARHASAYEALFGALPPLDDAARFPAAGMPGDPRWAAMHAADRDDVSRVLANVGKALAAFQRGLRVQPTALDRYASGETLALTAEEKDGIAAFFTAGCAQCHYGPRLSDDAFHTLRFPTGHDDGTADRGRLDGLARLRDDEFSRAGSFSDAPRPRPRPVASSAALGAFRTPGLRGVPFTMPYGHGGGFGGLASVIDAHRTGGLPPASRYAAGETEPWAQRFDPPLTARIVRFLQVLRADLVTP